MNAMEPSEDRLEKLSSGVTTRKVMTGGEPVNLHEQAYLTGWPTPVAQMANGEPEEFLRRKRESVERTGNSMGIVLSDLNMVVKHNLTGWPTPNLNERGKEMDKSNRPKAGGIDLQSTAQLANHSGWAIPTTRDYKDGASIQNVPENALLGRQCHQVHGTDTMSSTAETEKAAASQRPVLNPAFSAWLMGFSLGWILSGIRGIRSHGKRLKADQRSLKE